MDCRDCSFVVQPGNVYLLNGLPDARRTKNGDCSDVCSSPGLRSAHVAVQCGEYLGAFAERLLFFSL